MSGIVERLREKILADAHERGEIGGVLAERLIRERREAADEIARLRAGYEAAKKNQRAAERAYEKAEAEIDRLREALRLVLRYSDDNEDLLAAIDVLDRVDEIYMDPPDVGKSLEEVTAMYGHMQLLIGICRGLLMAAELRHQRDEDQA